MGTVGMARRVLETTARALSVSGRSSPPTHAGTELVPYLFPPENAPMFQSHEQKPVGEPALLPALPRTCHDPGAAPLAGFAESGEHPSLNRTSSVAAYACMAKAAASANNEGLDDQTVLKTRIVLTVFPNEPITRR